MILKNCDKCWGKISERLYQLNQGLCYICKQEPKPTPKPIIKKEPKVKQVVTKEVTNTFKWLPLYTASHLHNKLKINLNSIKNETCCIKVWDNYILHTDIVTQFKEENFL